MRKIIAALAAFALLLSCVCLADEAGDIVAFIDSTPGMMPHSVSTVDEITEMLDGADLFEGSGAVAISVAAEDTGLLIYRPDANDDTVYVWTTGDFSASEYSVPMVLSGFIYAFADSQDIECWFAYGDTLLAYNPDLGGDLPEEGLFGDVEAFSDALSALVFG